MQLQLLPSASPPNASEEVRVRQALVGGGDKRIVRVSRVDESELSKSEMVYSSSNRMTLCLSDWFSV